MRVGVVFEGLTDFFAIKSFFGHALREEVGVDAQFVDIRRKPDNTNPAGGWGSVLFWLDYYNPAYRIQKHFKGGLLEKHLGGPRFDAILIQLDSDILGDQSFTNYVRNAYGLTVGNPDDAQERADEIRKVIRRAAKFDTMTDHDIKLHVIAPAVESTESWCVAAFTAPTQNCEILKGQDLIDAFMSTLIKSEGRDPTPPYAGIDKNQRRRKKFLETHAQGSARVRNDCQQFDQAYRQLRELYLILHS